MDIRTKHKEKEKCGKVGSQPRVPHRLFSKATQRSNNCFPERAALFVVAPVSLRRRGSS